MNKTELIQLLQNNHQNFIQYIQTLEDKDFDLVKNNKWTAGQHLEHINRSVAPLLLAFSLPTFILRLVFGKANRASKSFAELVKKYQEKLAAGGKASKQFTPPQIIANQRLGLIHKLQNQLNSLSEKINQFTENQLDGFILPHPLIGKITLREMLYFTAYHVQHHEELIKKNLLNN